ESAIVVVSAIEEVLAIAAELGIEVASAIAVGLVTAAAAGVVAAGGSTMGRTGMAFPIAIIRPLKSSGGTPRVKRPARARRIAAGPTPADVTWVRPVLARSGTRAVRGIAAGSALAEIAVE